MRAEAVNDLLSGTDVNGTLRFIMEWLTDLDARLTDEEFITDGFKGRLATLEAEGIAAQAELTTVSDSLHAIQADVASFGGQLTSLQDRLASLEQADLPGAIAALQQEFQSLEHELRAPRHFTITIPGIERNTNMAFSIVDSDHTKVASLTYTDALGFPTTDAPATVVYASADPAMFTVDASTGSIAPVGLGTAALSATVTNTDGSVVTGVPVDVDIVAGPATTFVIGVA